MAHAHGKRIVHGDVSPGNILVDGAGAPMLVDFGLAAAAGDSGVGGTPGCRLP